MSLEVMKQALEALGAYMEATDSEQDEKAHNLMATVFFKLKEAIEQAEKQEPVAFASHGVVNWIADKQFQHEADLYTTPQPMREWVSLTLDEIWEICKKHDPLQITAYARAIEKALKEKNT